MGTRGHSLLIVVALAIAVFVSSGSTLRAAPIVEPGSNPDALLYGGVRYRLFASGPDTEVVAGEQIDSVNAGRVGQHITWVRPGSNAVTISLDPTDGRLVTRVNDNEPLVYRGFDAGPINYLRITVKDHDGLGSLQFADVSVDGTPLGTFASATPAPSPGCITTSVVFPYGYCTWGVTGLDIAQGFTLRASIVLSGGFSTCVECALVEVRVGYLASADSEGPEVAGPVLSSAVSSVGSEVAVSASVDDRPHGGSVIRGAELSVAGGPWVPMDPRDGGFDAPVEPVVGGATVPGRPDAYDVCVRGSDVHGNRGRAACSTLVVFDPNAGFLTAGGWFPVSAGSLQAAASYQGRATFGLTSRYSKGAQAPTGSVEFQLHGASLNFHGDTQDWLLVTAGSNAHLRSLGTLNGQAGFALEAWLDGSAGQTIRVRIWDTADGATVFDNGAAQAIGGGGSITVHTPRR